MKESIKSMKNLVIFLIILIFFLYLWNYFTPIVIKHPKPSLSVDISPFIKAGCVKKGKYLNCSRIGLEKKYACDRIAIPSQYLGGLRPKVAIAECEFYSPRYSIIGDSKYFLLDKRCIDYFHVAPVGKVFNPPDYVIVGEIADIKKEKVIDKNCTAIKVSAELEVKRVFMGGRIKQYIENVKKHVIG